MNLLSKSRMALVMMAAIVPIPGFSVPASADSAYKVLAWNCGGAPGPGDDNEACIKAVGRVTNRGPFVEHIIVSFTAYKSVNIGDLPIAYHKIQACGVSFHVHGIWQPEVARQTNEHYERTVDPLQDCDMEIKYHFDPHAYFAPGSYVCVESWYNRNPSIQSSPICGKLPVGLATG